jgi:hypothetical protein
MPSANKTPNYELNQWQGNEYPKRQDFVEDNEKIDAALTPTADSSQVPIGNGPGKLVQWVSWIANRIKAITGKSNWWDNPDTTLANAKAHIDAAAPHSGHETPAGAQAKANAAASAVQTNLNTHDAKDATTGQKGHVQLTDSVSSTSVTTAATPKNVKQAYDLAAAAIPKSLATAANDFLVASGAGTWVKKTLAEVRTLLACLLTSGDSMSGELNMQDNLLTRPYIKNYAEVIGTTPATTGTVTLDLTTGNVFNLTPTGNVTIGFSNPPANGRAGSATIILTNGATVYSKTFNASIKWVNDFVPDTSEANKVYILVFMTTNGGTTWRGSCIGAYTA